MHKRKIIVADVNEQMRQQLVHAINQTENLTVVGQTGDVKALLALCRQHPCDIIVADLALSALDGLAVLEQLRTCRRGRSFLPSLIFGSRGSLIRSLWIISY